MKQISHVTAKVLACENAVDSHERRFAAMDQSISELMRGTEDKLRELRIRRETSMEVDGQAQATVGRPPDRDIAFQCSMQMLTDWSRTRFLKVVFTSINISSHVELCETVYLFVFRICRIFMCSTIV